VGSRASLDARRERSYPSRESNTGRPACRLRSPGSYIYGCALLKLIKSKEFLSQQRRSASCHVQSEAVMCLYATSYNAIMYIHYATHTEKQDRTYVGRFSLFNRVMKHVASKAQFLGQMMNSNSKMYALLRKRKSAPKLLGYKLYFMPSGNLIYSAFFKYKGEPIRIYQLRFSLSYQNKK
jgi:hypothetical protein